MMRITSKQAILISILVLASFNVNADAFMVTLSAGSGCALTLTTGGDDLKMKKPWEKRKDSYQWMKYKPHGLWNEQSQACRIRMHNDDIVGKKIKLCAMGGNNTVNARRGIGLDCYVSIDKDGNSNFARIIESQNNMDLDPDGYLDNCYFNCYAE